MNHIASTRVQDAKGRKQRLAALLPFLALVWGILSVAASQPAMADIVNTATVTGTANGGPITATATESVDVVDETTGLTVVKSALVNDGGDGTDDPGDTISYTFTVTNGGNVSLADVTLADPLVTLSGAILTDNGNSGDSSDSIISAAWDLLGPGDTLTYTATYMLTAGDVGAGQVVNTATADAATVPGAPVTGSDTETTFLNTVSTLSLAKVATLNDGGDGIANAGDTVSYSFTVTNTGTVALNNVSVSDPLLNVANLPGRTQAFAMMAAAATGADPMVTASTSEPFDPVEAFEGDVVMYAPVATEKAARMFPGRDVPQLAVGLAAERKLVMLSGDPGLPKAGDRVGIYFNLVNTGEGPLTNITVEQQGAEAYGDKLDILAPNTRDTAAVIFTRLLTDEDVASGVLTGAATIRAKARDRTRIFAIADDLPLVAVSGMEELATATITPANVPSLAPGASTVFTATLTLSQADIDAGVVNNSAVASATDPFGATITAPGSASTPLPPVPGIALLKQGTVAPGPDGVANVGDVINYTFSVRNTGNVTLSNITLVDPVAGVTLAGGPIAVLAPDAVDTTAFTATYTITQADLDLGHFDNQAEATGTLPDNTTAISDFSDDDSEAADDVTVVPLAPAPAIALLKMLDTSTHPAAIEDVNNNGLNDSGDRIHYSFAVHNTGNVTLDNVYVQDRNPAIITTPLSPTGIMLAPGAADTTSFAALYTLTQADVDAGSFNNTADAYGTDPNNTTVTDESDPGVLTAASPTIVIIPAQPGVALLKQVASINDVNGNSVTDTNDVITYAFTVINTGNVTLTGVTISDANASVAGGPIATLLPGTFDNSTFTATHVVNAGEMLAGRVTNQATATASTPASGSVTDLSDTTDPTEDDPTITPTVVQPGIAVLKQVTGIANTNANAIVDAGDTIQYVFHVRNTGNVPLSNVTISDPLLGIVLAGGPIPLMDAGDTDTTTFTATYVLTAADILAGEVVNQATASGSAPNTVVVQDVSDESDFADNDPTITFIANAPSISLVKTVSSVSDNGVIGVQDAGDVINYAFTVVNTGNVALTNVTVTDPNAVVTGGPLASLGIAATDGTTFSGQHVITVADVVANGVTNQATASATGPTGPVSDLSDESDVTDNDPTFTSLTQAPGIAVIKTVTSISDVNGNALVDAGDVVHYGFAIHNTGNVPLTNVTLSDGNAVVAGGPVASLAPGAVDSTTYAATHVVTLADQDVEEIVNQASVLGTDPLGGAVSDLSDPVDINGTAPTVTAVAAPPAVLTKTVAKSGIIRGEHVTYTITASSLRNGPYDITDIMPPGFNYVPGSATVNGVAVEPVQSGNVLTFANLTPDPASDSIVVTLQLLASATVSTGSHVNRAQVIDSGTGGVLGTAQVAVLVKEEHIFDCGEIIGRVFDDLNSNGYADDGEPGLPGVRVVTVKGLLVTTDKRGRFHVPCADVPNAMTGSNFLMKLDPRTLPADYRLTTENPRDVRLTRGKITKLNFGASRDRNIDLELRRDAFAGTGVDLKDEWLAGVDRLVGLLAQGHGQLNITYRCAQFAPIARDRLLVVKDLVAQRWQQAGHQTPLRINTRVECSP